MSDRQAYWEILSEQTGIVKTEVQHLQDRLHTVSGQLDHLFNEDERIVEKLNSVRSGQKDFHVRIKEAKKKLRACKSALASVQS